MPATGCRPCAALPMMTQRPRAGARRLRQGERIRHPAADFEESAESKPKAALHLGEKFLVRPRHGGLCRVRGQRQHQRAAAPIERQQRQRTVRREALVGDVVVKALRQHRGDHGRLADNRAPRRRRRRRLRTAECAPSAATMSLASIVDVAAPAAVDLDLDRLRSRALMREPWRDKRLVSPAHSRGATKGRCRARGWAPRNPWPRRPCSARVDSRKAEASLVRDVNLRDRRRQRTRRAAHDADGLEDPAAAVRRAPWCVHRSSAAPLRRVESASIRATRRSSGAERDAQARADHAAADDRDIERVHRSDLDGIRSLLECAGQHFRRALGHQHFVFDANADVPKLLRNFAARAGCRCPARPSAPCPVPARATRRRPCNRRHRAHPARANGRCDG